jgi:hypothetical protein
LTEGMKDKVTWNSNERSKKNKSTLFRSRIENEYVRD